MDDATLDKVADGRVFTGRQAVPLKLIDELGDERAAVAWLAKEKNIDPKTPVRDYKLKRPAQRSAVPAHRGGDRPGCGRARLVRPADRTMGRPADG